MTPEAPVRYTNTISKGSALLTEMLALFQAWTPQTSLDDFEKQVLESGLLGTATAQRNRDLVRRVFARRFLRQQPPAAIYVKQLAGKDRRLFSDLCLLYSARADTLLYDLITNLYGRFASEGRGLLTASDVVSFLRDAETTGAIPEPWTDAVKAKAARSFLKCFEDFGLVRPHGREKKEIQLFLPSPPLPVYLAYELRASGVSDAALPEHRDWSLFGFDRSRTLDELSRLSSDGWWIVQSAGSVVRFSWTYPNLKEAVDVLAR